MIQIQVNLNICTIVNTPLCILFLVNYQLFKITLKIMKLLYNITLELNIKTLIHYQSIFFHERS